MQRVYLNCQKGMKCSKSDKITSFSALCFDFIFRIILRFGEEIKQRTELPSKLFESIDTLFCGILQACDWTGDVSPEYLAYLRTATATFHLVFWEFAEFMINFFQMSQEEADKWKT